MNIVFITIDDKFFLPSLFDRLIPNISADDEIRAIFVKPLYKNDSSFKMALKYLKTFGIKEFFCFSFDLVFKSILSKFSTNKKHHKASQIFSDNHREFIHFDGDVNGKECLNILKSWNVDLLISVGCPQLFKRELIIKTKHFENINTEIIELILEDEFKEGRLLEEKEFDEQTTTSSDLGVEKGVKSVDQVLDRIRLKTSEIERGIEEEIPEEVESPEMEELKVSVQAEIPLDEKDETIKILNEKIQQLNQIIEEKDQKIKRLTLIIKSIRKYVSY